MNAHSDTDLGPLLLGLARHAIAGHLGRLEPPPPQAPELATRGATFVSLYCEGVLRGCIGSVVSQRMLVEDVTTNAIAAASRDPRFAPLTLAELDEARIEVSLLSEPSLVDFVDEDELLGKLQPGIEGVMLASGVHHATFLPQVWEQLPEPKLFLAALKEKAGLRPDLPAAKLKVATYRVRRWRE